MCLLACPHRRGPPVSLITLGRTNRRRRDQRHRDHRWLSLGALATSASVIDGLNSHAIAPGALTLSGQVARPGAIPASAAAVSGSRSPVGSGGQTQRAVCLSPPPVSVGCVGARSVLPRPLAP